MKRFLPLLALCCLPGTSHAITTYCVHDAKELQIALFAAINNTDTPVIVNLRKGTYDAGGANGAFVAVQNHSNQTIVISGGWSGDNGECTQHANGASATVLVGNSSRRTLALATSNANPNTANFLYLSDLTLTNPDGAGIASCLDAKVTPGSNFTVERLHFDGCISQSSEFDTAVGFLANGGQLIIDDVVARRGNAPFNGGITARATNGGAIHMTHLSLTDNRALITSPSVITSGLLLSTDANGSRIDVGNSVAWGNATDVDSKDIGISGPNIHLNRVHYGDLKGTPASNSASSSGAPGFVAVGDAHLRTDSILIDTGSNAVGGGLYDVDGHARVEGAAVDVGAYEWSETIFKNGFD